jgi:hypothetical protein
MCELYSQIWLNLPKDDRQFFFPISSNGWLPLRLHKTNHWLQ